MRRAALCASLLALVVAAPAVAGLPRHGTLVPGRSLGGVRLGQPAAQVRATLGRFYGVCRGCPRTTWYFTYRPFDQSGLGVELTRGHVSAVYTLWRPEGWTGPHGIVLGAFSGDATAQAKPVVPTPCAGYTAYVADSRRARTVYYVLESKLWGFGLFERGADPCR